MMPSIALASSASLRQRIWQKHKSLPYVEAVSQHSIYMSFAIACE